MKIQNALVSNIFDRSQRYFVHVTTVTLSWRVQNIVVVGRVYFTLECFEFSSNFEFDRNMLCGTGAWLHWKISLNLAINAHGSNGSSLVRCKSITWTVTIYFQKDPWEQTSVKVIINTKIQRDTFRNAVRKMSAILLRPRCAAMPSTYGEVSVWMPSIVFKLKIWTVLKIMCLVLFLNISI